MSLTINSVNIWKAFVVIPLWIYLMFILDFPYKWILILWLLDQLEINMKV